MLFANLCVGSYPEILSGKLLCIFFPQVSKMNSRSKQQCCRNRTDLQIFCDFVCGFHYHRMLLVLNVCLASKDEQVISWKKWKKNVSNTSSDKPTIFNSGLCIINPQKYGDCSKKVSLCACPAFVLLPRLPVRSRM